MRRRRATAVDTSEITYYFVNDPVVAAVGVNVAVARAGMGFLYLGIVLLCVGISVYTTYEGFLSFFGRLSPGIAIVIGCALVSVDLALRQAKTDGKPLTPAVVFLFFCMAASFPSHFNFFYSEAIGQALITDKVEQALEIHEKNYGAARARLAEIDAGERSKKAIEAEMNLLEEQINDPGRQGYGPRADGHVSAIADAAKAAGRPFTDFYRPAIGTPAEVAQQWFANDFKPRVEKRLSELQSTNEVHALSTELADESDAIQVQRGKFEEAYQGALRIQRGRALIEQTKIQLARMETRVAQTARNLDTSGASWQLIEKPLDPVTAQVGNVALSFRSGFVDFEYPHITLFAVLASLVIDLMPLMYVLLIARTDGRSSEQRSRQTSRPRRRRSASGVQELGD